MEALKHSGLLTRLIEPHPSIADERERRNTRLVTGLALALLALNTLAAGVYAVIAGHFVVQALASEAVFLAAYLLSRGPKPALGVGVLGAGMSAAVLAALAWSDDPAHSAVWMLLPILLAAVLASIWMAIGAVLINLAALIVVLALSPKSTVGDGMPALLVVSFVSAIAVVTKYVRDRDVQTLEEQARALTASRQRYQDLFDSVPVGLYQTTPDGEFIAANAACAELLGFAARDALVEANTRELYADAGRREQWQEVLEREGAVRRFESRLCRADGQTIWVRESARAVRDASGRVVSYRGSIEDITGTKLAQQELTTLVSVIEQSTEAVLLTDLEGKIIYANPAFERGSGYTVPEAMGQNPRMLKSGQHGAAVYADLWDTILAGETWNGVLINRRKDGSLYHEQTTVFPVKDVMGKTVNYAAVKRDVTDRVLESERMEQRNLELATLNALSQALASSLDLDQLLDEALSRTVFALGFTGGLISLVDARTGRLALTSYIGLPLKMVQRLQTAGFEGTLCGAVYEGGQPLWLEDLNAEAPVDVSSLIGIGMRAYAGTPIVHQGRTLGTLCLFDASLRPEVETESMLLVAIGQQVGVAVENARLFRETQERVRELQLLHTVGLAAALAVREEETQQTAVDALAAEMPGARVALLLVRPEENALYVQASAGYRSADNLQDLRIAVGDGITGWVAEHGEAMLVSDVLEDGRYLDVAEDVRSELCVPLKTGGQVVGVLNVESPQPNAFTADDERLLGALANNLAWLIERARLFEQVEAARVELQRRAEDLSRANDRLQELDRLKSEFLANMSHELRTPLNAILGFAQLMGRSETLPEDHRENLGIIRRSGEHLLDLINDVLDMSKIEAGRVSLDPTSFDLYHLLDGVKAMIGVRAKKVGLRLAFECAQDVPQYISTDERKLRQVLINLLNNAVKFTEEGGVTLRVSRSEPRAEPSPLPPGPGDEPISPRLCFEVADTGAGIAPEEMDGLFEAFTQTASGRRSQEGTGLGLPISRKFVQMMGGDVRVSSQIGQGSSFRFDIRVELADKDEIEPEEPTRRVTGLEAGQPVYRILVVDDRAENRVLVRELLQSVGFEVREAVDGREAIELHQAWEPQLIFMDIRMPGMDGYEATQRIKATLQGQATIIVALTASALKEDRAAILSAGCDDYMRKPFLDSDLFAKIGQHLGARYRYAHTGPLVAPEPERGAARELSPEAIAELPAAWVAQLHDAASRARGDLVTDLLAELDNDRVWIAEELARLVDEFRFDVVMELAELEKGTRQ